MCLYPTLIKNKRYIKNKKNGGQVPAVTDRRIEWIPIGCQNCIECRKQKAREWQIRLSEEIRNHKNGKFICLTFNNESLKQLAKDVQTTHKKTLRKTITLCNGKKRNYYKKEKLEIKAEITGYNLDNAIATLAMRRFNERYRKEYGKAIRHWTITELGSKTTEHIHIHGILWTDITYPEIKKIWGYGYIWPRPHEEKYTYVSERTINYVIKYVTKIDPLHKTYKSIILSSSGIGAEYIYRIKKKHIFNESDTSVTYKTRTGHEIALPTYYRNKIWTDEEREALWLHTLDKNERWVNGEKIDISKDERSYFNLLKWHQRLNKEMGFGTGKKDWNRAEYEKERRELIHGKRGIEPTHGKGQYKEWKKKEYKPHEDWDENLHWTELNFLTNRS